MRTRNLLTRNLSYYWRTNLAVILGVATAVAVLAGALLVGDSVRASLRDLFVQRLGNTDSVITASGFFRDQLAADIQNDAQFAAAGFRAACPLIAMEGTVSDEGSGLRASGVRVYGVDERFWKFHERAFAASSGGRLASGANQTPRNREVLLSAPLARELGSVSGNALVLRMQKPSEIPIESLHSRKEDLGDTLRLTVNGILGADALGEFSLQPQQGAVRAVFVPLALLQKQLEQDGKVNVVLISEASNAASGPVKIESLNRIVKERALPEDLGVQLRVVGQTPSSTTGAQQSISVEHDSKVLNDALAEAARKAAEKADLHVTSVLSYLANSISVGDRSIPYSLVTALGDESFYAISQREVRDQPLADKATVAESSGASGIASPLPAIILNEWAARDLGAQTGAIVSLEYYVWHEGGGLETKTANFRLVSITPIAGLAADRDLVPEYPGITGSENLADWNPPFPVDLKRIRQKDEDYWHQYRTTPKAFIPLAAGQRLWQSRFGKLTSLRLSPKPGTSLAQAVDRFKQELKSSLGASALSSSGFSVTPARQQGLAASQGATNFGEYFLYFSFFLVVSALMLTALFFKLGIEQRLRELGVLQAAGFSASRIRSLFLMEGVVLSVVGSLLGLVGAIGYGQLMMFGLRTWWVDAVGTTMLRLYVSPMSLLLGAIGGVVASLLCVIWTLRQLGKQSTRSLLMGTLGKGGTVRTNGKARYFSAGRLAVALSLIGLLLLAAASVKLIGQVPGFFGGGTVLLAALLCYQSAWLRRDRRKPVHGSGLWPVARLGFRNATFRPGRSVLCIALIASSAFIIVSVDAFRHRENIDTTRNAESGSGGFPLLAESLVPLVHDPNTREGREALNLTGDEGSSFLGDVTFARFRVKPGDDASCLNLYQPRSPKIIAPADNFIESKRFVFQSSLASTNEEKQNPWLLLRREFSDGAVPVIADANSMTYVLHLKLGDDFVLNQPDGPVRLRFVGALSDSIFQSELVMDEKQFLRLFPEQQGYRLFLIDTPAAAPPTAIAATLEDRLSDFGFDVVPTAERLATFHRVENTYLSTFQLLGGLGLVLGTLGMAAVLLRNVLERRRELALLRAVGYNSSHFMLMVVAENLLLLVAGLLTGTVCALLAISPVFFSRGGSLPHVSLGLLLLTVLLSGLTASLVATWAALKSPLLPALRAE